jgi:nucleoside-diphosphate-sugar epimerase
MKVLVIGGTRFIGPAVVTLLNRLGHEVTVFHRGTSEVTLPSDTVHLHGDRRQLAGFASDFKRIAPDVVLDTVAYTEHDAQTALHVLAGIAQRFVVLSSMDVYRAYGRVKGSEAGPPDPVPLTEDAPLRQCLYPDAADSPEARNYDNILVERVVMSNPALPGTVLRLPAVYGPRDYQHRLFYYLKRMDDHRPIILLDEQIAQWRWTRGYVENMAAAIALAVTDERAAGRIYNVGEEQALTEADWVRAIGRVAGWRGDVVVVPRNRLPLTLRWWGDAAMAQDWLLDTTRIRAELG